MTDTPVAVSEETRRRDEHMVAEGAMTSAL